MNIQSVSFNEVEIEVCDILLNLKDLIQQSESRSHVSPYNTWSSKKKRPHRSSGLNDVNSQFCPSPNSVQRNNSQAEDSDDNIDPTSGTLKPDVTSPDTPLSLSPIEFDDKPMQYSYKKSSKRKTRDELMHTIEKLTRCRELLKGEVENVRTYYNSQQAYNLKLKAIKKRVMTMLKEHEPETSSGQHFGISTVQPHCHKFQYPMGQLPQAQPMYSSANGLGSVNQTGPLGIPNLSVNLVDWAFAERKAQFAEARRKRKMKIVENKRSTGLIRPTKGDKHK